MKSFSKFIFKINLTVSATIVEVLSTLRAMTLKSLRNGSTRSLGTNLMR
jgi:hypothetical protein